MIPIWIIVNPPNWWYAPGHARDHDGHREGPQGLSGDGLESPAKPRPNQRGNAQAGATARQRAPLSDELGGTKSGHPAYLHHWVAPAGIRPSLLRRDCARRGSDGAATRLSCCNLIG